MFDIQGWFDFQDVYDAAVERAIDGAVFVEVGCWRGCSTCYLAQRIKASGKAIAFRAVDTWRGSDEELHQQIIGEIENAGKTLWDDFAENVRRCGVDLIVMPVMLESTAAAAQEADGSIDFVFLDGDHAYASVVADIRAWLPKIKPGGVLAGHDYHMPGVRQAVDELLPHVKLNTHAPWPSWIHTT